MTKRTKREAMSVRLGISPIGWSNDDLPELGGDIPLDTCLAEARQAGFEGIELDRKFPRDLALLKPLLAHHKLRLISGWYSGACSSYWQRLPEQNHNNGT